MNLLYFIAVLRGKDKTRDVLHSNHIRRNCSILCMHKHFTCKAKKLSNPLTYIAAEIIKRLL